MHWTNPESWSWIPFVLSTGREPPKMNIARILEQVIGAVIISGIVLYGTVQVIGAEMKSMQKDMQRMEASINEIRRDFYQPALPGHTNGNKR